MIYQGVPSKVRLLKSDISYGICIVCHNFITFKHIISECDYAKQNLSFLNDQCSWVLQGNVHWHFILFDDWCTQLCPTHEMLWYCLRITTLFILWNIRCKEVLSLKDISLYSFLPVWQNEAYHRHMVKGALQIKYALSLDTLEFLNLFQ